MIQSVARITAWEWFKLRRRWMPWILLGILILFSQLFVWGNFFSYRSALATGPSFFTGSSTRERPSEVSCRDLEAGKLPPEFPADTPQAIIEGLKQQCEQLASRHEARLQSLQASFTLPGSLTQVFTVVHSIGLILIAILAASMMGTDYSWGTLRSVLARGMNRWQYLAAKFILVALLTGGALVVVVVVTAVSSTIAGALASGDAPSGDWGEAGAMAGRTWVALLPYAVLGITAAVVTGSAAAAIGIGLAYFFAEQILAAIFLALFDWFPTVADYLLGRNVTAWMTAGQDTGGGMFGRVGEFPGALHALLVLVAYVVAMAGLSFWLFLRRDVRSASGG